MLAGHIAVARPGRSSRRLFEVELSKHRFSPISQGPLLGTSDGRIPGPSASFPAYGKVESEVVSRFTVIKIHAVKRFVKIPDALFVQIYPIQIDVN